MKRSPTWSAGTAEQANPLGPTTTIRSASTTVLVQDHRTAVIGGLISDDTSSPDTGVPFFSDIPVIGNLFSDTSRTSNPTNLLVFLTPHVIRSRSDLRSLSLDEREKFIKTIGKKEVHDMPAPQLRDLYKPSFSIPVSPADDLRGSPAGTGAEGAAPLMEVPPSSSSPAPVNTEEINPSSSRREDSDAPEVASGLKEESIDGGASTSGGSSSADTIGVSVGGASAPAAAATGKDPAGCRRRGSSRSLLPARSWNRASAARGATATGPAGGSLTRAFATRGSRSLAPSYPV